MLSFQFTWESFPLQILALSTDKNVQVIFLMVKAVSLLYSRLNGRFSNVSQCSGY